MLEPYSLLRRAKSMKWKSILPPPGGRTFSIRHQTENKPRRAPLMCGDFPAAAMILSPAQHSET
jgi:hypothetical protein